MKISKAAPNTATSQPTQRGRRHSQPDRQVSEPSQHTDLARGRRDSRRPDPRLLCRPGLQHRVRRGDDAAPLRLKTLGHLEHHRRSERSDVPDPDLRHQGASRRN